MLRSSLAAPISHPLSYLCFKLHTANIIIYNSMSPILHDPPNVA